MKKTILATLISVTSFGAMAAPVTDIAKKDAAKQIAATKGVQYTAPADATTIHTFTLSDGSIITIDSSNGVATYDAQGAGTVVTKTFDNDATTIDKANLKAISNAHMKQAFKEYVSGEGNVVEGTVRTHVKETVKAGERDGTAIDSRVVVKVKQNVIDNNGFYLKGNELVNEEFAKRAGEHLRSGDTYRDNNAILDQNKLEGLAKITGANSVTYDEQTNELTFVGGKQGGKTVNVDAAKAHILAEAQTRADSGTPIDAAPIEDVMPINPTPELGEVGEGKVLAAIEAKKEELSEDGQNLVDAGQSLTAYQAQQAEIYATTYASQQQQIDANKQDIATLFGEVDRLDEKMDGVMAGVHAVNNARPYLSSEGDTAIGAGVGYAGDAGAVAFGAAHAFTDSLSASMTLNVTTGSYSEVSGGAGVQYKF